MAFTPPAANQKWPAKCMVVGHWRGRWSWKPMSDWIKSGADAPPRSSLLAGVRFGRAMRPALRTAALTAGSALLLGLVSQLGHARDRGQYASTNPELKAWFDSLRSGKGPCCSDADGAAVSDVDWESGGGHYRVRLGGEWIEVPDEAVITEPNRVGRTMVWPMYGYLGVSIRCFMPGSMT
jgi:hypothetical protein